MSLIKTIPIFLAAGHGGADSGAVNGSYNERDQVIQIVKMMAEELRSLGHEVITDDPKRDTHETVAWINKTYHYGDVVTIEVHRDSGKKEEPDASRRFGIYRGASELSKQTANRYIEAAKANGAHSSSWVRDQAESNFKRLMWIAQTNTFALLLELGFMEGRNDSEHLQWLAHTAAVSLHAAVQGIPWSGKSASVPLPEVKEEKPAPPAATEGDKVLAEIQGCPITLHGDGRVSFLADADIDCDGSGGNPHHDPFFQPDTTLHHEGKALDAEKVPFIVVPKAIINGVSPEVMGCQARVTNTRNGKSCDVVVGDVGPSAKIGELSTRAAELLGINSNPNTGGEEKRVVLYEIWPGTPAKVEGVEYKLQKHA